MADNPLDWPFFAPHHRALAARLQEWAAGRHSENEQDAASVLAELGAAGWLEHAVPEGTASQYFDCRALFLIREMLAERDARAERALLAQGMAAAPIIFAGSPEQRARLAEARSGSWRLAPAALLGEAGFRVE